MAVHHARPRGADFNPDVVQVVADRIADGDPGERRAGLAGRTPATAAVRASIRAVASKNSLLTRLPADATLVASITASTPASAASRPSPGRPHRARHATRDLRRNQTLILGQGLW